jgi:hypothetical protein
MKLATTNSPIGAPTIPLKTANTPLGSLTPTAPAGSPLKTGALPKATVSLNPPTQPLSPLSAATKPLGGGIGKPTTPLTPSSAAAKTVRSPTLTAAEQEIDETGASTFAKILAGVGFLAACVLLYLQLSMAGIWINDEDFEMKGEWMSILEEVN